ncbi:hypothetical protein MST22_17400 [Virgibacillus halodenitrificans]|uniref:hypothetical protein n=1 Tax=Virgibacillus halodenitrificans TaxID=1482 RepID=UPI001FB2B82E|nr:hypothetical protein [Virgibacillus halodenitrificans]MCJ0932930.1 hypothetical protein [Virgibacillus halodenitrificans]
MVYVSGRKKEEQINFLASAKFQAFTKQVSDAGVAANADGKKIVPAGTVYPANDATAEGILLNDVDVTEGPQPASLIVEGYVLEARLPAAPVQLAKDAMTEIKFR